MPQILQVQRIVPSPLTLVIFFSFVFQHEIKENRAFGSIYLSVWFHFTYIATKHKQTWTIASGKSRNTSMKEKRRAFARCSTRTDACSSGGARDRYTDSQCGWLAARSSVRNLTRVFLFPPFLAFVQISSLLLTCISPYYIHLLPLPFPVTLLFYELTHEKCIIYVHAHNIYVQFCVLLPRLSLAVYKYVYNFIYPESSNIL